MSVYDNKRKSGKGQKNVVRNGFLLKAEPLEQESTVLVFDEIFFSNQLCKNAFWEDDFFDNTFDKKCSRLFPEWAFSIFVKNFPHALENWHTTRSQPNKPR